METIKIGFDNDVIINDQDDEDELQEGPRVVKSKIQPVYISPERFEKMKNTFDHVVVHEYGDEYHLSEEERKKKNAYYETFKRLKKTKKTYRKIDEYVEVMRIALECLDAVAENNGVYDPEKFKHMFLRGKIYINGLKFPKYKGRDKKNISWEYLAEFILSNKDPIELMPKNNGSEFLDDNEIENLKHKLFSEEEIARFNNQEEDSETKEPGMFNPRNIDEDDFSYSIERSKKETNKLLKTFPEILYSLKEIRRSEKSRENMDSMISDLVMEDIEMIERYDAEHGYISEDDIPEFKGNMLNSRDYKKYLYELKNFEDHHIKENYGGRMKTIAEIREIELKEMLEKAGWNIRSLYDNKEKSRKIREARKRDEREKRLLKKKLKAIDERNRRRAESEDDYYPKKKKKKKKKSKSEDD